MISPWQPPSARGLSCCERDGFSVKERPSLSLRRTSFRTSLVWPCRFFKELIQKGIPVKKINLLPLLSTLFIAVAVFAADPVPTPPADLATPVPDTAAAKETPA